MFKKHIQSFIECIRTELPTILEINEREDQLDEDLGEKNIELIIGSLSFICNAFASVGVQNKILSEKCLLELFDFFDYFGAITNEKYIEIYHLMLMLYEQIYSNRSLLLTNADFFISQI